MTKRNILESDQQWQKDQNIDHVEKIKKKIKFDFKIDRAPKKDKIKITFIGQPNVGKSSLLNALVGTKIEVSNYPGTSVEITQAEKIMKVFSKDKREISKIKYIFIDTPGIYSISDRSPEETITKRAIFSSKENDIIILIADVNALERSLYFALQILESGKNLILGLNFVEDAYKKGISVNITKLSQILGVPVVRFNPITKNIKDLLITATKRSNNISAENFNVKYDDHIERLIKYASEIIKSDLPPRFIGVRLLEEDPDFLELISNEQLQKLKEEKKEIASEHPNIKEEISKTRFGTAAYIAEKSTHIVKIEKEFKKKQPIMDRVLFHRFWGPIFTLFFFLGLFFVLLIVGGEIEELLVLLGDFVIELIPEDEWAIGDFSFLNLLREGLAGGFAGIAIALPYVLLFYLILGFTEDIGLLPRFVVNIEKIFSFFGLPSKSFITMILGVGCTVPAITSTRIIPQKSDRLKTACLFAFIPCSSRIGIIMGVVGFYGGFIIALATFGTIFIAMMIWAFIMKRIMKAKPDPMLIELPAYRRPIINNVFSKSWLRMKSFIYVVIPLLIGGGIIYSILDQLGITALIIEPFRPFMEIVFNLPGETIVPLVFGFVQKDLTGAMLLSVFEIEDGLLPLTNIQLYTFGLASCIGVPCIIALGTMFKEYGLKNSLITLFSMILYGTFISNIAWRVAILFI